MLVFAGQYLFFNLLSDGIQETIAMDIRSHLKRFQSASEKLYLQRRWNSIIAIISLLFFRPLKKQWANFTGFLR